MYSTIYVFDFTTEITLVLRGLKKKISCCHPRVIIFYISSIDSITIKPLYVQNSAYCSVSPNYLPKHYFFGGIHKCNNTVRLSQGTTETALWQVFTFYGCLKKLNNGYNTSIHVNSTSFSCAMKFYYTRTLCGFYPKLWL